MLHPSWTRADSPPRRRRLPPFQPYRSRSTRRAYRCPRSSSRRRRSTNSRRRKSRRRRKRSRIQEVEVQWKASQKRPRASPPAEASQACGSARSCSRTAPSRARSRSEEHTSELQSRLHLVCRLLLEKKKKTLTTPGVLPERTLIGKFSV